MKIRNNKKFPNMKIKLRTWIYMLQGTFWCMICVSGLKFWSFILKLKNLSIYFTAGPTALGGRALCPASRRSFPHDTAQKLRKILPLFLTEPTAVGRPAQPGGGVFHMTQLKNIEKFRQFSSLGFPHDTAQKHRKISPIYFPHDTAQKLRKNSPIFFTAAVGLPSQAATFSTWHSPET